MIKRYDLERRDDYHCYLITKKMERLSAKATVALRKRIAQKAPSSLSKGKVSNSLKTKPRAMRKAEAGER